MTASFSRFLTPILKRSLLEIARVDGYDMRTLRDQAVLSIIRWNGVACVADFEEHRVPRADGPL